MAIQFERDELKNWIHSVALEGCKTNGGFIISKDNTPENIYEALMQVKRHIDMAAILKRVEDGSINMSDENPIMWLQLVLIMDYFSRELSSLNTNNEPAVVATNGTLVPLSQRLLREGEAFTATIKMSEILNRIPK
ncbi:MAG TPA: hypothetical protein VLC98_06785 [Phnomibacter sp.]|nr:hypothetical protein [Phnomibacter sp.]